jgi:NADH-quinone oxidoreductase subunit J
MTLDVAIFFISAIVAVFGATMMITVRNPVASVLYLLVSFAAQAVLFIQLGALFLGVVLIIVYVGAILVLFLFVVMLLNLRGGEDLGQPSRPMSRFSKYLIGALLLVELVFVIRGSAGGTDQTVTGMMGPVVETFGSVQDVGMLLYTTYLYPFELTGVLLLVAIVGAVVIAKRETEREAAQKKQLVEERGHSSEEKVS